MDNDQIINNPPEFTEQQVRTGLRANIAAACFAMIWFGITQGLPMTMMMEALGASGVMIGMLSTLNQMAMLFQIPGSLLADRMVYSKRFWVATTLIARLVWFIPALLLLFWKGSAQSIVGGTLIVVGMSALLIQSSAAAWWNWMANLIPESERSRFWSIRQGVCTSAMLFTIGAVGWFLDRFPKGVTTGFGVVLLLGAIVGCADILIQARVPEPASTPSKPDTPLFERLIHPLRDRNFRTFTLVMCVWFFGLGLITPFTMVYLKQQFQALYQHLSWIQMAGMLGSIGTSFYAGKLIQRAGLRTFGIVMLLLSPLFSATWFFLDHSSITLTVPFADSFTIPRFVLLIIINSLLGGSVYMSVSMYQFNMLTSIVPRDGRTIAMAVHWFLIGAVACVAPLIAGRIKDMLELHPIPLTLYHGMPIGYLHVLLILHAVLIWLVVLPMSKKLKSVETDMTVVKALSHIFIANPLRMAREIYGFNGAIISTFGKAKEVVTSSTEMAIDAVAHSTKKVMDAAKRVKRSAKKTKNADPKK